MANRISLIVGMVLLVGGIAWWIVRGANNLPGEAVADLGREHKSREELEKVIYNSNPPTSGPHDPDWTRPGVYPVSQDKFKLIHSLEHGYIIIHYNCDQKLQNSKILELKIISNVKAHADEGDLDGDSTPSATASPSASPSLNLDDSCLRLIDRLTQFVNRVGPQKLVVQPNPEIDKPIVLTAWARILPLDEWDEELAAKFVKAFRDKGPEQTPE